MRSSFREQLEAAWQRSDSFLCVGLDPDLLRLPEFIARASRPHFEFCKAIVDATADLVCAFKPQFAFFAAQAAEDQLADLIGYIHECHPQVPVILDAKRGDVASTAEQYALEAFQRYDADALTVNPYLGWDSIEPYLAHTGRGVAVLCHTSNPDSATIQDYPQAAPLYLRVAALARECGNENVMLVAGATYPEQLGAIREAAGDIPLLVPGIGAQGGDVEASIVHGRNSAGVGLVMNASRSVIYASGGDDFAEAAKRVAGALRERMRVARATA